MRARSRPRRRARSGRRSGRGQGEDEEEEEEEEEDDDEEEEEDEDEGVNRTLKAKLGLSVGRVLKVSASLALKICMMLDLIFLPLTYTPLVLFKSLQ